MVGLVAEFEAQVPARGFDVEDGALVDRVVAAGLRPGQPRLVRPLSGLLGSGLFMTFAGITDVAGVLAFANRYGPLGLDGERVEEWLERANLLRSSVALWHALRDNDNPDNDNPDANWYALARQFEILSEGARVALTLGHDRPLVLRIVADSLLGALWVQFAQAVAEDRDYRACQTCGRFFELTPATARSDRKFCSGACRNLAYRSRKQGKD